MFFKTTWKLFKNHELKKMHFLESFITRKRFNRVSLIDSSFFETPRVLRRVRPTNGWYITRCIHSKSFKVCLVVHVQERITVAMTDIDRNMLLKVCIKLDYHWNMCRRVATSGVFFIYKYWINTREFWILIFFYFIYI